MDQQNGRVIKMVKLQLKDCSYLQSRGKGIWSHSWFLTNVNVLFSSNGWNANLSLIVPFIHPKTRFLEKESNVNDDA